MGSPCVCGIAAKGDLLFMLRNYCPGLAGLSHVCIHTEQLGPWEDGEGSNGMDMEGTLSMLPLDSSPPAEVALKLTLVFAVLACRNVEQKPWGLALLQPAAQGQRELSAVTALPVTLMRVWASRAEGAGLLLRVPASVSACLSASSEGLLAAQCPGSVLAQLNPAVRQWQGCAGGALHGLARAEPRC